MEPPECPVCLQSYDGDTTIPRVLGCGHSACEPCLAHLNLLRPITLPHTLRCPCCTHLVNFPNPQGPSALPKNIDLLRFSLLLQDQDRDRDQHTNSKPQKSNSNIPLLDDNSSLRRRFLPRIWSEELYSAWKDWILPYGAVSIEDELVSTTGRINISSNFMDLSLSFIMRCRLVKNHVVGLVKVGRFVLSDPLLEYSYVGKIMSVLSLMSDYQRNEISNILGVSMKNSRVCKVLGLWLDVENDGVLYLVTEKLNTGLLDSGYEIDQHNPEWGCLLGSIGVELCEAIISLHSEGFVCGFLNMSCLCFDEFGHVCIDIGEVLVMGRKFRECFVEEIKGGREIDDFNAELLIGNMLDMGAFVSPEVWMELLGRENIEVEKNNVSYPVCYKSDSWLLACVLINLLIGNKFSVEMYNYLKFVFQGKNERVSEYKIMHLQWIEMINAMLEPSVGTEYASVHEILLKCLAFDPGTRPLVTDVWKCIKGLRSYHFINNVSSLDSGSMKENIGQCLALGELCNIFNDARNESRISKLPEEHDDCKPNRNLVGENTVDNVVKGLSAGKLQCKVLQGHLDCVTGLCVGGGYLFSSSFDKTINVWSLQDFVHVHTFKGHEHKVMALVFLNQETPLCISADRGGGIYAWEINETLAQEPLKKWYEEKDWRYSGIHALAVSESGCLYTGSGDRLIKAWSLRDYTLLCSMEGHKSVVSTLALCNGILYSGSWDGTVRLWCLHDHSPLAVFGEDIPGTVSSVLSLVADQNMIIAAHENGCIKMWINDEFKTSTKIHNGAILALAMDGRWLFLGGWGRTINVLEITGSESEMDILEVGSIACDSVITAIRCVQGALFVGYANKLVKVMVRVDGLRLPFRKKQEEVTDAKRRALANLNSAEHAYINFDVGIKALEMKQEELVRTLTTANDEANAKIQELEAQLKTAGSDLKALEGADQENASLRADKSRLIGDLASLKDKHAAELQAEQARLIKENERDNEIRLRYAWGLLYPEVDFEVYKLRYNYATEVYDAKVLQDTPPASFEEWASENGFEVSDTEEPDLDEIINTVNKENQPETVDVPDDGPSGAQPAA